MRADLVNLVVFGERAVVLLDAHVEAVGHVSRSNKKYLGSAFMAPEVKAELATKPDRWVVSLWVKTGRCGLYGDDCDALGTESPSKAADAAAAALAAEYGLVWKWEPCEKGWGSYYFEGKVVS
jgi:hypothetical protein